MATSAMIWRTVAASDRTAPVQVASPTVRKRTSSLEHRLFGPGGDPLAQREQHPVAFEHRAPMGEVDGGQLDGLALDVLPDVELGPVRKGEGAQVLAGLDPALVELPELGTLPLGVPLAEGVAERQDALFGPRLVLVAAGPAEAASKRCSAMASSRVVVCRRLREAPGPGSATRPWSMESWTRATSRRPPRRGHPGVAVGEHLGEVVPGVDVEDRERAGDQGGRP